ncbi:uncharacterized protein LOC126975980 [Leptidea sinapis]|uniref:uncharacterized protein LOC126975980 n=1 Tax=Leptidea sinapis TaxID=189913 RepID=UPI0021C46D7B|nr:uncharacterized protein LOC126975980 [Leptidea sinapis]
MKLCMCVAIIYSMVHHCELVYYQRERIIAALDTQLYYNEPKEAEKLLLQEFRELALSRPICFHISHFATLNYSLMGSMASAVVTYTVILLQSVN